MALCAPLWRCWEDSEPCSAQASGTVKRPEKCVPEGAGAVATAASRTFCRGPGTCMRLCRPQTQNATAVVGAMETWPGPVEVYLWERGVGRAQPARPRARGRGALLQGAQAGTSRLTPRVEPWLMKGHGGRPRPWVAGHFQPDRPPGGPGLSHPAPAPPPACV